MRVSPRTRFETLADTAIPTLQTNLIEPFLAEPLREQALACQEWLAAALQQRFDGPTVAITHFAPSLKSADPRYGLVPGTAGFCNALDHLLAHAQLWLHGHLHAPSDYIAEGLHGGGEGRNIAHFPFLSSKRR